MRKFLSVVLTGGLVLVGVDVFERHEAQPGARGGATVTLVEDGTGFPPNFPPPPPPPR